MNTPRLRFAALLTVISASTAISAAGCGTAAQIQGPTIGIALEIDHDLNISPRLEAGYDYDFWYRLTGWGWGGRVALALLEPRLDLYGDLRYFAAPLLGFPLTFYDVGAVISLDPVDGIGIGPRLGLSLVAFDPPESCVPPLEGDWDGCPAGQYETTDTVYPIWVPRFSYRFHLVFYPGSPRAERYIHSLGFDPTIARWWLQDDPPGPVVDFNHPAVKYGQPPEYDGH